MKRRGPTRKMAFNTLLLATSAVGAAFTTPAFAQDSGGLDDIIITGTKREENLQDVPISVQALGQERLEQLGIGDFADYAQHLPTLSYSPTYGPGYNRPFMRGVASGENGNHSASMPSVGTYLDEQPITTITGNLDLHLYDVARIEVLAGPQGTLYGASSQSGTVRIITNRPDSSGFSASYDAELNTMPEGDWGQSVEGYVNIPLGNRAAVRIVAWEEQQGGYIDNVAGTRLYPTSGDIADNSDIAEDDYNTVDTIGGRISLGIDLNESWTITPQIMGQRQESNGIFAQQRSQGDLEVMHWFPEWNEDSWVQGALTVEGQISNFDITFAASRLERDVDSNQDYADYGYFYDTYLGSGAYFTDNAFDPINPAQQVEGRDRYNRDTYELRVASPAENPLRFILGAFYQHSEHRIHQRYVIEGFNDAHEVTGWADTIWLTEQLRTDEETALFGEVAYDFTPNLTATFGMRAFQTENSLRGYFGFNDDFAAFYGLPSDYEGEQTCIGAPSVGNEPCTNLDKSTDESGELYRANLTYRIDDDRMIYATYSEGFRPGGINRRGTQPPYTSDYLINYEAGWKTDWAAGRLRWNGAVFFEEWQDFQFSFLGANGLTEIQNAGDAEIRGVETDLSWAPTDGLFITAAATYIDSELTSADIEGTAIGTALPVTPDWKLDFTARYEFPLGQWQAFVQGNTSYVGDRSIDIRTIPENPGDPTPAGLIGNLPSYWLTDLSVGIEAENYTLSFFVDNVFDERAITGRYTECKIEVCFGEQYDVIARPLMVGVRFGQSF
ncbi:MAG TPA: TonB-dependent receptor [Verrucomicrobiae bacterium]|nr:TonB-dependent receptor [Verrucomicrobiae bacterium]